MYLKKSFYFKWSSKTEMRQVCQSWNVMMMKSTWIENIQYFESGMSCKIIENKFEKTKSNRDGRYKNRISRQKMKSKSRSDMDDEI